MYTQDNVPPPEYRVRTVVRYVVTRYCHPFRDIPGVGKTLEDIEEGTIEVPGGSTVVCEVAGQQGAYDIAQALAKAEGATVQRD